MVTHDYSPSREDGETQRFKLAWATKVREKEEGKKGRGERERRKDGDRS